MTRTTKSITMSAVLGISMLVSASFADAGVKQNSKMQSSQFTSKSGYSRAVAGNYSKASAFSAGSSKLQTSRLIKQEGASKPAASGYTKVAHNAKPHRTQ